MKSKMDEYNLDIQRKFQKSTTYFIKTKMSNKQTFYMEFDLFLQTEDTKYWNVCLAVFNKRKHAIQNENNNVVTGTSPMETILLARQSFRLLEKEIAENELGRNYICVCWTDNRRRDAYAKALIPAGYRFDNFCGLKCLRKIIYNNRLDDVRDEI